MIQHLLRAIGRAFGIVSPLPPEYSPRANLELAIKGTREQIIAYLTELDRDGCYTDEEATLESGKPHSLGVLLEILLDQRMRLWNSIEDSHALTLWRDVLGRKEKIEDWYIDLVIGVGMGFHPDTPFSDYQFEDSMIAKDLQIPGRVLQVQKALDMAREELDVYAIGVRCFEALERMNEARRDELKRGDPAWQGEDTF